MTFRMKGRGPRTALALAFLLAFQAAAMAQGAVATRTTQPLEPADSLEGNYLAAIVAGAGRDLGAASTYLREAIKGDPQNADLLERGFVAFLADGAMSDAFRAAEKLVQRDASNGLAQLALGIRAIKLKNYQQAMITMLLGIFMRLTLTEMQLETTVKLGLLWRLVIQVPMALVVPVC